MFDRSLNRALYNQNKKTKMVIIISALGILMFIVLASLLPFKDQLLSRLYPKPSSQAAGVQTNGSGKYGFPWHGHYDDTDIVLLTETPPYNIPNAPIFSYTNVNDAGSHKIHTVNACYYKGEHRRSTDGQNKYCNTPGNERLPGCMSAGCAFKGDVAKTDTVTDILNPSKNRINDIAGFKAAIKAAYNNDPQKQYWTVFNEPEIINTTVGMDYEPPEQMGGNVTQQAKYNWLLSNYDKSNENYTTNPEQYAKIYIAYYKILYDTFKEIDPSEDPTTKFTMFFPGVGTNADYWRTYIPAVISAYHILYSGLPRDVFPENVFPEVMPIGAWTFHAYPGVDPTIAGTNIGDPSCKWSANYGLGLAHTKTLIGNFIGFIDGLDTNRPYTSTDIWLTEWGWIMNHADEFKANSPYRNDPCVSEFIFDVIKFLETDPATKERITKSIYFPSGSWAGKPVIDADIDPTVTDPGKTYACIVNRNQALCPKIISSDNKLSPDIQNVILTPASPSSGQKVQWFSGNESVGTFTLSGSITSGSGQIRVDEYAADKDTLLNQYIVDNATPITFKIGGGKRFAVITQNTGSSTATFSNVKLIVAPVAGGQNAIVNDNQDVAFSAGACNGKGSFDAPANGAVLTAGTTVALGGWGTFCSGPKGTNRNRVDIHKCNHGTWDNCTQINGNPSWVSSVARPDVVAVTETCGNLNPNKDGWNYYWTVPNAPGNFTLRAATINDPETSCVAWSEKNITITSPSNLLGADIQNGDILASGRTELGQKVQWFSGNESVGTFTLSGSITSGSGQIRVDEYAADKDTLLNQYIVDNASLAPTIFDISNGKRFAVILQTTGSTTTEFKHISLNKLTKPDLNLLPTLTPTPIPDIRINTQTVSKTPSPLLSQQVSATFSLTSNTTTSGARVGDKIKIAININTPQAANLFTAKLKFPADLLQVSQIDLKAGTTFIKNWVENFYDNTKGTTILTGAVPDPGFQTSTGKNSLMAEVIFTVKKAGRADISFDPTSSIYRNSDSINILKNSTGTTLLISNVSAPTPTKVKATPTPLNTLIPTPTKVKATPTPISTPQRIIQIIIEPITSIIQRIPFASSILPKPTPTPAGSGVKGDLNNSAELDLGDLSALLSSWNKTGKADLNGDGKVNTLDYTLILSLLIQARVIHAL